MFNAVSLQFDSNIKISNEIGALHSHLKDVQKLPNDLTDLLRMKWVYAVSALDKLVHELVRIGMIEVLKGNRAKTAKFSSFTLTYGTHELMSGISSTTSPQPPEFWFEQEIVQRHKIISFQDPDKISEGLSLIWNNEHKWQAIATALGSDQRAVKQELKNIVNRRNQIVHEADINPVTGLRNDIDATDVKEVVDFIERLGKVIISLL